MVDQLIVINYISISIYNKYILINIYIYIYIYYIEREKKREREKDNVHICICIYTNSTITIFFYCFINTNVCSEAMEPAITKPTLYSITVLVMRTIFLAYLKNVLKTYLKIIFESTVA